jgi:hypothetical protein
MACAAEENGAPDSRPLLKLWASSAGVIIGVVGSGGADRAPAALAKGVAGFVGNGPAAGGFSPGVATIGALGIRAEVAGFGDAEDGIICVCVLRLLLMMCACNPGTGAECGVPTGGTVASVFKFRLVMFPRKPGACSVAGAKGDSPISFG